MAASKFDAVGVPLFLKRRKRVL